MHQITGNSVADILREGNDIVAAGYCMYGSATELVVTFGHGVHRFTLDPTLGEFIHVQGHLQFPPKPKTIYSCNEGNYSLWDPAMRAAVDSFKQQEPPYAARYVGSMVSDVHRTMLYGGIFLYPADRKSKIGKLRVLYEGFPMAKIVEEAGGVASTGLFQGKIQRWVSKQASKQGRKAGGGSASTSACMRSFAAPSVRSITPPS